MVYLLMHCDTVVNGKIQFHEAIQVAGSFKDASGVCKLLGEV